MRSAEKLEMEKGNSWTTVIRPETSVFNFPLRELWEYRDLLILFVRRDFVTFYKQTILGPLWFIVQPVFTTLVYILVFGRLANIGTDGIPQPIFFLAGITAWTYFAECMTKTSTVFKDNAQMFGKVYFPRLVVPLSIVISNLIRFGVQLLLFLSVLGYYLFQGSAIQVQWSIIYILPLVVAIMALLGLGLGLIITALTTKYRDLTFLVTFGVQLMMYATTVVYPLSAAPPKWKNLLQLHPMTGVLEAFRYGFTGQGEFNLESMSYSVLVTIITLLTGILIFNKTERSFIDTI